MQDELGGFIFPCTPEEGDALIALLQRGVTIRGPRINLHDLIYRYPTKRQYNRRIRRLWRNQGARFHYLFRSHMDRWEKRHARER